MATFAQHVPASAAPDSVEERRAHERHAIEIPVSVWSPSRPTERFEGMTADLSAGGALLRVPGLPALAATLDLRLGLPAGAVAVSASIRWRRAPDLVGVSFERIEPHGILRLGELLATSGGR
jgi:PilZ domain